MEAIARKIKEGKPNLVILHLRKYDNEELVDIISELTNNDDFDFYHNCDITINKKLCVNLFPNMTISGLTSRIATRCTVLSSMPVRRL